MRKDMRRGWEIQVGWDGEKGGRVGSGKSFSGVSGKGNGWGEKR